LRVYQSIKEQNMLLKLMCTSALLVLSLFGFAHNKTDIVLPDQANGQANGQVQQEHLRIEAQQKIAQFASQLKTALVSAVQEEGLVHAVNVCHELAPKIARELSTDGWQVARTSLKTRSDVNKPDQWELETLEDFDRRFKAGTDVSQLTVARQDDGQFRYMKAIPTDQICLACHGSSVDDTLIETINKKYPNDRALGFTLEDLRGAFTLKKKINE
jgi:hypothetical protein